MRRVQAVGYSTLSVSIPKRWAERVGLRKGSTVTMVELPGGALLLLPEALAGAGGASRARLELPGATGSEVIQGVIALYEAGYDVIEVAAPPGALEELRRSLGRRLVGVEVFAEGGGQLVLRVMVDHSSLSARAILGRMVELVERALGELRGYAADGDRERLRRVVEGDDELDRLYFLLARQVIVCLRRSDLLYASGFSSGLELLPLLHYGKALERMGDTLTQAAMYMAHFPRALSAEHVEIMLRALRLADGAFWGDPMAPARELMLLRGSFLGALGPRDVLGDPLLSLVANFLALCLDAVDSRVELEAVRRSLRP